MSVPHTVPSLRALSLKSHARTPIARPEDAASSRETPRRVGEGHRQLSAAQSARLMAEFEAFHTLKPHAAEAYEELQRALLLTRTRCQEVPCLGPGRAAWTSDDPADHDLAADLCLLCPIFAVCQRYAEAAQPKAGTWAGVTRAPSARERRRSIDAEAHERRRRGMPADPTKRKRGPLSPGDCRCRCGGTTKGGRYLSGDDSRHLSALLGWVRSGTMTIDDAVDELADSPALEAKLRARLAGGNPR